MVCARILEPCQPSCRTAKAPAKRTWNWGVERQARERKRFASIAASLRDAKLDLRAFPGIRFATSGAIFTSSLREECRSYSGKNVAFHSRSLQPLLREKCGLSCGKNGVASAFQRGWNHFPRTVIDVNEVGTPAMFILRIHDSAKLVAFSGKDFEEDWRCAYMEWQLVV